ncbi:MAG: OsmC family peroxiredoxin [Bacteroidales bacterium]|nr:OsmC family peroxiredoxin [Bacteroidales bacterium]
MSISTGKANWSGNLKKGKGTMAFGNYTGPYTFASRFESGEGTNPEELIGAALSGCYSMFLSGLIGAEDLEPEMIETVAKVRLDKDDKGPLITTIELDCQVKCSGLSESRFDELAKESKAKCPVSRLYQGAEIKLNARLI